ncbi:MAG: DNA polymerase III subunit alpha, partial [Clostridia bacterium]|nr:DNA polymerase III subunit alpha [Clostridia bacterium]
MANFVHLHTHTAYSLLDGACRIEKLIEEAKKHNQPALAITDHGVMYGVVDFYKEAKKQGIKPIIGCELYIAERTLYEKEYSYDSKRFHVILLAKNNVGYQNLVKLVSIAHVDGFYVKPRIDKNVLRKYSEGLICLSACIAGEIPQAILSNDTERAKQLVQEYISIFGKENFFLEMQNHGIPEEMQVNAQLVNFAREFGVGIVATNDVHYVRKKDARYQDILMCIQMGKKESENDRMKFETDEMYLKSSEEMSELFKTLPIAIENTVKIADMCNVELEFGKYHLPEFKLPPEVDHFDYLKRLCFDGLKKRYENYSQHIERLKYEVNVINDMGFTDYFLIVWDFVKYAKENGIYVGPGRGSAAGSLVSYCLDITTIDPIKYNLIFERFLNPARITMPDIDMDFCIERRGEVINYVREKYGNNNVAQIITFGTLSARSVIRDVGRVISVPYADVDAIAKMIPAAPGQTIENALNENQRLRDKYNSDLKVKELIDIAMELEGLPRHASTHAAGVVITGREVSDYVPLALSDEQPIIQYVMTTLEELGLLKMDFLGLRNLTVIKNTVNNIKLCKGEELD